MYIVRWLDHEGRLHKLRFGKLRYAEAEAFRLSAEYEEVEVVPEK